jgi:hypothetical protein
MKRKTVFAGVLADSTYTTDGESLYVATVFFWIEYGTKYMPARAALRSTEQRMRDEWVNKFAMGIRKGLAIEAVLERVGFLMEGDIRDTIKNAEDYFAPNAERTLELKKGRGHLLVHTGTLMNSITHILADGVPQKQGGV